MQYHETIEYLYGLQNHGVKFGLSNSEALMSLMGRPHARFRSIHIAGTNGKGSTAAFLSDMLRAAGFRTGLYTSPHLVSFTERIRINGERITEERVVDLAGRVRTAYIDMPQEGGQERLNPTFFEVTTAMAFTHFAEEGVDIAVIEAGMGGRLDSTNVITPLVSVITNIDLEHTEFLGDTVGMIAGEKSGIIKQGVPVVTGAALAEAIETIEREAGRKRSPVFRLNRDFMPQNIRRNGRQVFDYSGIRTTYGSVKIGMRGAYQIDNACLALAAVECVRDSGVVVNEDAVRGGLERTAWEGRLEMVSKNPDILLDGAHNPASARLLASAVLEMKRRYRNIILIIGVLQDKDYRGIIRDLSPVADRIIATMPSYSRALDIETLSSEIMSVHQSVETAETVSEAVALARKRAGDDDLILVTGSLYVVGEARAEFVTEDNESPALKGLKG